MTPKKDEEKLPELGEGAISKSGLQQTTEKEKEAALKALRDQDGEMEQIAEQAKKAEEEKR